MKWIFSAFATEGHVGPVYTLAKTASEAGIDVVLITHAPYVRRFQSESFRTIGIDSDSEFDSLIKNIELLNHPKSAPEFFRRFVFPVAARECKIIMHLLALERGLLISTDAPGIGVRVAAESTGTALVSLFTAPGFYVSRPLYAAMLDYSLQDLLNKLREANGVLDPVGIQDWLNLPRLSLGLWPTWFWKPRVPTISNFDTMGFLKITSNKQTQKSALGQPTSKLDVIITGGTGFSAGRSFFQVAVEACASLELKTLVLTKYPDLLPTEVPEHVSILPWVDDMSQLLGNARVVIHHGGMGSTIDAIAAGIPQIVLAIGGDRPLNGDCVARAGIGFSLHPRNWTKERVSGCLQASLLCPNVAEAAKKRRAAVRDETATDVVRLLTSLDLAGNVD